MGKFTWSSVAGRVSNINYPWSPTILSRSGT